MLMNMLPDWALKPLFLELKDFFDDFEGYISAERPADTARRLRREIDQRQEQLDLILNPEENQDPFQISSKINSRGDYKKYLKQLKK